jgi:hypothetical protein
MKERYVDVKQRLASMNSTTDWIVDQNRKCNMIIFGVEDTDEDLTSIARRI